MEINKKLLTKTAKTAMIDVHSEKYIKAWIDVQQFGTKVAELEADWNILSEEAKARVQGFVDQRTANTEGKMIPEADIAQAVSTKLGLDVCKDNLKRAQLEFDFFADVIAKVQSLSL